MQTRIINILLLLVLLLGGFYVFKNMSGKMVKPELVIAQPTPSLPVLPPSQGKYLMDNCTYVDVTFNNLPFSMSIDNKPGIQSNLAMIDAQSGPVALNPACQPLGTIYYDVNAETILTADIMYGEGCNYFLFKKNNEPVFANRMTAAAIDYFTNVITKITVQ